MTKWVVLLRGINVGGRNKLPMAGLRDICQALWPESQPRTYIASGNLIIEAAGDASVIATDLGAGHLWDAVYGEDGGLGQTMREILAQRSGTGADDLEQQMKVAPEPASEISSIDANRLREAMSD